MQTVEEKLRSLIEYIDAEIELDQKQCGGYDDSGPSQLEWYLSIIKDSLINILEKN